MSPQTQPVLPEYEGACTANVVPELIKATLGAPTAAWLPSSLEGAKQIVLLVLDGLGWEQLQEHSAVSPTLTSFDGGMITTVAPTTTAAGLTSIVSGRPPSVHGILGYRMSVGELGVLNVLRWEDVDHRDLRSDIVPTDFQIQPAFAANEVPAVVRQHFKGSGFSRAHLQGAKVIGYSVPSSLPVEIWRMAREGEQFIYAYYDGIDTVAHAHGFGEHYDAELYTVDRLIRDILAGLPRDAALVVTSDHGQVSVGNKTLDIDSDIAEKCWRFSGEGRFRWLHAHNDDVDGLAPICRERYGDLAWVMTKQELSDAGWFGGPLDERAMSRLGDVALIASDPVAFHDPTSDGERNMACRHGSMTAAEVRVPLLASRVE